MMSGYCESCGETICICGEYTEELQTENEKLQAQVAMLREAVNELVDCNYDAGFEQLDNAMSATEQDVQAWKQQVRDEAYERAADNAPDDASERYLRSLIGK